MPLDHVLRLEPAEAHRRDVAELGALDRQAHLLGHRREDRQLLGQELAPLLGDEHHHAPGPVLDRDRQRELGAVSPLGRHLPDLLFGGRRGVQMGDDDLAGAHGVAHVGALERAVAGAIEVAGIDAALPFQDELAGVVVQAIDHADVHPREAAHDLERLAGGGGQVGAAAHRREHRVQRFQLAVAPLERHAGAVRGRPRPCRRARPAGRRQERQHHAREHHRAGPQQGEELQQQAVLGPRELPHRQHDPEAAVGRRHDGLREPANREGLVAHVGGADRGRAGPAAPGQVAPAGRERAIARDEDHRRSRGEPVEQCAKPLDAPAGHHGAGAAGRLAPGRALHRRGDEEVRLAARQPQGQDRLGRRPARRGGSAADPPAPAPGACRARHGS